MAKIHALGEYSYRRTQRGRETREEARRLPVKGNNEEVYAGTERDVNAFT